LRQHTENLKIKIYHKANICIVQSQTQ